MKKPRRDSVVSIRITDEEMVKVRAKAASLGVSISELLRRSALAEPEPDRVAHTVTLNTSRAVFFGDKLRELVRAGTITLSGD